MNHLMKKMPFEMFFFFCILIDELQIIINKLLVQVVVFVMLCVSFVLIQKVFNFQLINNSFNNRFNVLFYYQSSQHMSLSLK